MDEITIGGSVNIRVKPKMASKARDALTVNDYRLTGFAVYGGSGDVPYPHVKFQFRVARADALVPELINFTIQIGDAEKVRDALDRKILQLRATQVRKALDLPRPKETLADA